MITLYTGKRVLTIGASKRVLIRFTDQLIGMGFHAVYSDQHDAPASILETFSGDQFDIIAMGRGVRAVNKSIVKAKFSEQNSKIAFVDGLAPIANLLVDQIKEACLPKEYPLPSIHVTDRFIRLKATTGGHFSVKYYHLNWLYMASEQVLLDEDREEGMLEISRPTRKGKNFVSISKDGIITNVLDLNQF